MIAPDRTVYEQAADWLLRQHEAPGDEALRRGLEAWLDADPDHAVAWVAVGETYAALGEIAPESTALARLRAGARAWRPSRLARPMAKPARRRALLAGAMAACLAWWLAPLALVSLTADATTAAGEVRTVQLADGSVVELAPASAIAIDLHRNERIVRLLAGEAWFAVAHNPRAPFHVDAGAVRTTALGTAFDVQRNHDGGVAVALQTGRVRVAVARAAVRELAPGQWVQVGPNRAIVAGSGNPALFGAWQTGTLVARDRPIADMIDELRPWYRGRIVLLDPRLGQHRVDGAFDARDPRAALAALVAQAGGTVRQFTPWLLVVS